MRGKLLSGVLAGAVGTAAINATTYLDMAVRGRPASPMPQQAVRRIADLAGISLGDGQTADNRRQGLAPMLGFATGVGTGAVYGLLRTFVPKMPLPVAAVGLGAAAMAGSGLPATLLGVTDPGSWSGSDWLADVVPHLVYGLVTAATFDALSPEA